MLIFIKLKVNLIGYYQKGVYNEVKIENNNNANSSRYIKFPIMDAGLISG